MKHLKKFNEELKSAVYHRASLRLGKLGHTARQKRLQDWSKVTKEREDYEKWKKNIENFSIDGTYRFQFITGDTTLEDDFYINLFFDDYILADSVSDINGVIGGYISFMIGIIPTDEASKDDCKRNLNVDYNNGHFWGGLLSIPFKVEDDRINYTGLFIDSYDESQAGIFRIADRKTAVKLRKQIWEIFSGREKYPSGYTDESDMKKKIEKTFDDITLLRDKFNSEDLANFIKSVSVNNLYKE
jgi:hypothetical protein